MKLDLYGLITSDMVFFSTWRLHGRHKNNKNAERKKKRKKERENKKMKKNKKRKKKWRCKLNCRPTLTQAALPRVARPSIWFGSLDLSLSDLIMLRLLCLWSDCAGLLRFLDFLIYLYFFGISGNGWETWDLIFFFFGL